MNYYKNGFLAVNFLLFYVQLYHRYFIFFIWHGKNFRVQK